MTPRTARTVDEPLSALESPGSTHLGLPQLDNPNEGSRRRREIARIIDDMQGQLHSLALNYWGSSSRTKALHMWKFRVRERTRTRTLALKAAGGFRYRSRFRGFNAWVDMMVEHAVRLAQLRASANTFLGRGKRAGLNTLVANRQARLAARASMSGAAQCWVRQGMCRAWRRMAQLARVWHKAKNAARSMILRRRYASSTQAHIKSIDSSSPCLHTLAIRTSQPAPSLVRTVLHGARSAWRVWCEA